MKLQINFCQVEKTLKAHSDCKIGPPFVLSGPSTGWEI